jgi:hypothetical protein
VKPAFEVADIIGRFGDGFIEKYHPNGYIRKTIRALLNCRTAAMGYHEDVCTDCGCIRISYNSCRNRHCPKCQNTNRERWIEQRREDLLPVTYFHVVFTLPHELNGLCLLYPEAMYDMLFASAWQTVKTLGYDYKLLGAETGMVALLHTWGQTLVLHPHLHCIVPGGGLDYKNQWKKAKSNGKYLFPREVVKKVYKGIFFKNLRRFLKLQNIQLDYASWKAISQKKWVVYAKTPFLGPEQVIEYLGRYSHKTAISNHRLLNVADKKVAFSYKDYNRGAKTFNMELDGEVFLQRFALHILPKGFFKIRHYGLLSATARPRLRALQKEMGVVVQNIRQKKDWKQLCRQHLHFDPDLCPVCKTGRMVTIAIVPATRAPPLGKLSWPQRQGK